ncbi:MAG: hypothetical protein NWE95_11530 [Candidatus Bathyarchaeota archaeon]|nr:hypothetical protein [Candidatus Bathyarchaeota archaeon]
MKSGDQKFAYVDNRKEAKSYGCDLWKNINLDLLIKQGLNENILYSQSQRFPDFLFKTKIGATYSCGSLLELKDSKSASIASFNSTIPTKTKTLEEIDIINGKNIVSKIASIIDGELPPTEQYMKFDRRCFYLVRTNKGSKRVKISIIDGAFFETLPKQRLFHEMLLHVYHRHLEKKGISTSKKTMEEVEKALRCIDDQTIIACSQDIEKASVRPRLRIMAEVHSEGNPHSSFYPQIKERSFNLILQSTKEAIELKKHLCNRISNMEVFTIKHKRNGEHIVFQYRDKSQTQLH